MAYTLYKLLSNKKYYSLEINYVSKLVGLDVEYLESTRLSNVFDLLFRDRINVFTYNGVRYIGLESQRIRYEQDAAAGINWVEDAIKRGKYS